jgi:preprotein translocase subunit SecE
VTARFEERRSEVAKTSPGQFFREVRSEASKVVWPSRRETVTTAIMVMIMTFMLAIFFFGVDAFFNATVQFLLSLLG